MASVDPIENADELLSHGDGARQALLRIARASLSTADPYRATLSRVSLDGQGLCVDRVRYPLDAGGRVFLIGAGKASFPIAKAVEDVLGDRIHKGLIVAKTGQTGSLSHSALWLAAHPIPDESSLAAGKAMVALLREVRSGDLVIACITGGSSALLVAPAAGITLSDKAETNRILLACGADIREINAVRKHISRIKGGRLAQALPAGTRLINLTVSDVIGDPLDYITDCTVPDSSTLDDARRTLDKYGLWQRLPHGVRAHLEDGGGVQETPGEAELAHLRRQDVILVPSDAACRGAHRAALDLGYETMILSTRIEGESRELGRTFGAIAKEVIATSNPLARPCAIIAGGETTVTIAGAEGGRGGPNQEFAAAAALEIDGLRGTAVLGLDTDGTDGPTDIAGALVDGGTIARARRMGVDLRAALMRHDVAPCLERLGDALRTGQTGTNVNDLKILLMSPEA